MSFAMLLIAFAVLACIAAFFAKLLNYSIMEGTVMSVSTVITVMFLSGLANNFNIGIIVLSLFALIGIFVFKSKIGYEIKSRNVLFTPAFVVIIFFLILNSLLYAHDYIQHIDELHQWAMIIKYMLGRNSLPAIGDYMGDISQKYGTSLFILFFQKFTGYNESFMYVAASLLYWIGFMLPLHKCDWKNAKKVFLYAAVVYLSLYAFYFYGGKNLYVDLATAGWAAGITVWWITGHSLKDKNKLPVLIAGIIMVYFFKSYIGILMDLLIVMFVIAHEIIGKVEAGTFKITRKMSISACVIAAIAVVCGYAGILVLARRRYSSVDVKNITYAFIESIINKPLTVNPTIKFYLLTIVIILVLCAEIRKFIYKDNEQQILKNRLLFVAEMGSVFIYLSALFMAYLLVFSYEEAIEMAAVGRYFSIIGIFVAIISWSILMTDEIASEKSETISLREGYMFLMLIIFSCSMNSKFACNMSGFGLEYISDYSDIQKVRSQLEVIQENIGESDRVYFIDQKGKSEYPSNFALYTLENNVSNYVAEPWKFTEQGSIIRVAPNKDITIDSLPQLLSVGEYDYLWVYSTNKYLDDKFAEMFDGEQVYGAALYKISFSDGAKASLTLACDLDE